FFLSSFLITICEFNSTTVNNKSLNLFSHNKRKLLCSSCLFDLYALILNSLLRAHAYPGKASHISIHFLSTDNGLILKLTGFNQHLLKYLEKILKIMYNFQINEENTVSWKQELKDEYFKELINSKKFIK
ncbi:unnamed protein product, partial [Rotaria sp. Silwood2]